MVDPLLETKLHIPKRRPALVPRPRLMERLDQGAEGKLTLVSAPAGFGKTTLLAEWLAATPASERPAAWVSLDQSDNDPALFWAYCIAALQTLRSGVGETALSLLHAPQPPPIESVLTTLINEVNAIEDDFALILDDYHVIQSRPIHEALAFLLDHLPPPMHLIIASRADPPLPLARLRGRGELNELRAADLRFTPDEAAAFLNEAMGLGLSAADVAVLEARTEGWIVGLQLAALSMQGRDELPGFIRAFAGDHRYIVDYLVDEVLHRQPDRVRDFLLQTSVLDRLTAPLCDALTGREDGRGMLEALERDNMFVVPLDDKRRWFRYHHLFADVLRARALAEQPHQVAVLHQRASAWYERNGLPSDAVRHALAAEDFGRAAGLLERAGRVMLTTRHGQFLGWVKALPDEVIRARPVLGVYYAVALLPDDLEAAEARLRDAEGLLDRASARPEAAAVEMVVVDDEGFRSLPGTTAIVRAYLAGALGDVPGVVHYARRALNLLPEGEYLWRGAAGVLLGLAHWTSGDLEEAYRAFAEGVASLRMTGDIIHEITGAFVLANIRMAQGRLREAVRLYEQALKVAADQGVPMPPPAADLYVGLSELRREHDDLGAAVWCLQRSRDLGEHGGLPENRYRWFVAMARIEEARGNLDHALDLLDEAERRYIRSPNPDVRPVAAMKARVWARQGRLAEALGWVRERGLSVDDDVSYLREFEHITLARVLIARSKSNRLASSIREAMAILERLRNAAEEGGRIGSVIEILGLQALAHEVQGDIPRALAPLARALALAEPEGYVRIFVDEGQAMRTLLRQAAAGGITSSYTQRLLSAFGEPARPASTPAHAAGLVEPLTGREVEILRLVAAGMRNQEIADQLVISPATIKRHLANAYGKLGVGHRTEAIVRANELNLL
ncbi:MAG: helix-turn-helix transcriptional regulator [Chloroflexi bacterium]|nr:helix-turn-helix transcriptional regulator [Chloroflexota bacterium]